LRNGLDIQHAEDAIQRLEAIMWALEALRVFDDRLRESLGNIKEAKDSMQIYINQVGHVHFQTKKKRGKGGKTWL
jgi:hypothetical protein